MNGKLTKVATMIKKTFHTQDQTDCFDGCILYMEERCSGLRSTCLKDVMDKFDEVKIILKEINDDVKAIKKDIGLNGSSG